MIGNNGDAELEEYVLLLQVVRDHMLRREQSGQPLVLQLQREGADGGDQVTLLFGQVMPDQPGIARVVPRQGDSPAVPDASLPFLADMGPLLLQALALQVLFGEQRRRMAAPLEKEAVGRLQRMKLNCGIVARLESEEQGVCSICQESFSTGCEVYRLPCGHMFDVRCLNQWLELTRTCPNCRFVLQDVDQQYKDVVAPVWWRSAGENEEEEEAKKFQSISTVAGGESLARSFPPTREVVGDVNEEAHSDHSRNPQEVFRTQQQEPQQEQPQHHLGIPPPLVQSFRTSSLVPRGSATDRETLLEGSGGNGFFPVENVLESGLAEFEPVPPPDVPQRTGEGFHEHLIAEEIRTASSVNASRLGEIRAVGLVNRDPQRPNCLSTNEEQRSLAGACEPSLPAPTTRGGAAAASSAFARDPVNASFPFFQRVSADGGEHGITTFMPSSISRPPEETQRPRDETMIRHSSSNQQPPQPTAVAGSARNLVRVLRRQRAEEVRRVRLGNPNSNISSSNSNGSIGDALDGNIARRQARYRPVVSRRYFSHSLPYQSPPLPPPLLAPPQLPLQGNSEESQRRVGVFGSDRFVQHELRRLVGSRSQPGRGNRRNLERYEAIIRGRQGGRF
ncbi:zinc finger protein, predicted [Trypanosoma cruzi]|nr:zinc finger protein, predicted [Trypanosoma cruzi]